jgi:hypothetical protein
MMNDVRVRFTVFFEEPFWIGIYECEYASQYEVNKVTFGAEPKDYEIYEFILIRWQEMKTTSIINNQHIEKKRINPKRMQRAIKKQVNTNGIGTKAQQALKLQQEQGKIERKIYSKEKTEEEKERKFELKQQKRQEKHKGH